MAQVRNNIIIQGLSGSLGNQLVIKQDKARRTIVAVPPTIDPNRVYTAEELARQEKFRDASVYARGAKDQPVYADKAEGTPMTPYNVAIADWFHGPEINEINVEGWNGAIGQTIRVQAVDDVQVTQVNVVIMDAQGNVYEQGAAVRAEGAWWTYTTTGTADEGAKVAVIAQDLPGNIAQLEVGLG